jgi:hypothetical protein
MFKGFLYQMQEAESLSITLLRKNLRAIFNHIVMKIFNHIVMKIIGAILMQDRHLIAFESRKINQTECLRSTYKKEILAIMHALK